MDETARVMGYGGQRQDAVTLGHVPRNGLAAGLDSVNNPAALGRTATIRSAEKAYAIGGVGRDDNIALIPGIGGAVPVSKLQQRRPSMRARA